MRSIEVVETLYVGQHTRVVRGRRQADGRAVVIKTLHNQPDLQRAVAQLRYEEKMLNAVARLDCAQVCRSLGLLDEDGHIGLVMDDIGGTSLRAACKQNSLGLRDILWIGEQVAAALITAHRARIAHKDINPNNIIYNHADERVQLIDFGIATQLGRETQGTESLRSLEGTPAYISPEQTGRTHRSLDYRSDFYSLGVTLYELLTGRLPFEQTELADLVFAILTTHPPALANLRPDVPPAVIAIVERLLSKSPNDRYQSAHGLLHDLNRCRLAIERDGSIQPFALGQQDRLERLDIPQKLYGRERASQTLLDAYTSSRSSARATLLMISGPSGIGKSSLMQDLQGAILQQHGYYAAGKHDQLRRHVPFTAFSDAMTMLVRQILKEPAETRQALAADLQEAVGSIGNALIDVAPAFELLIGKQTTLPRLGSRETENRLLAVLLRSLQALSRRQPLVLFLDDLQWTDVGTLKLLELLALESQPGAGLLVVGAYRNNELDAAHPLSLSLSHLAEEGVAVSTLSVSPLEPQDVAMLLADATHANHEAVMGLANLLCQKTVGNPFFVHELLRHLWDKELLTFDGQQGCFAWDLQVIREAAVPDNVVNLMMDKILALSATDSACLTLAACIGDVFDLDLMCQTAAESRPIIVQRLQASLDLGLLLPVGNGYRYAGDSSESVKYRFAHDRVRQAAYALLSPDRATSLHYAIGKHLWAQLDAKSSGSSALFATLGHLNKAPSLLRDDAEREAVAQLNLRAAHEAKRATAYSAACEHLETALHLLPDDLRASDRALHYAIQLSLADSEYLKGDLDVALAGLQALAREDLTKFQHAELENLRAAIFASSARHAEALAACAAGLGALGHRLPLRSPAAMGLALMATLSRALWEKPAALARAEDCRDPNIIMVMELLRSALLAAFHVDSTTYVTVILQMAHLSMRHGITPVSAYAYMSLAALFSIVNRFGIARGYGRAARLLAERADAQQKAAVQIVETLWLTCVDRPIAEQIEACRRGYRAGCEGGDLYYAGLNAVMIPVYYTFVSLARAEAETQIYEQITAVRSNTLLRGYLLGTRQMVHCLQGRTVHPLSFDEPETAENKTGGVGLLTTRDTEDPFITHYLRLIVNYLHDDVTAALTHLDALRDMNFFFATSEALVAIVSFYGAMTLTRDASTRGRKRVRQPRLLARMLDKLRQVAHAGPEQHAGNPVLVEAELAGLQGNHTMAAELYERACKLLDKSSFADRAGIAAECAARYYKRRGLDTIEASYRGRARASFAAWGATVKVAMLADPAENDDPVSNQQATLTTASITTNTANTATAAATNIDLPALMQVAQAISGEVVLHKLVDAILDGLRKVAGASRAVILLRRDDAMITAADTAAKTGLPRALLDFVARTQQPMLLRDVTSSEVDDPYLHDTDACAILCAPVLHRGSLVGLIYLENSATAGAFVREHLAVVDILAAQAAIALENARVYANMEDEVARRTTELATAHARLMELEKSSTEVQMAGGFAHEMRNALGTGRLALENMLDPELGPGAVMSNFDALGEGIATIAALAMQPVSAERDRQLQTCLRQLATDEEAMQQLLHAVQASTERALRITERILAYAQLGRTTLRSASASANAVVDALLEEMRDDLGVAGIAVDRRGAEEPVDLQIAPEHLRVVLDNLLRNAREAFAEAPATDSRRITVGIDRRIDTAQLVVEDSGPGVAPSIRGQLFQAFVSTKGTGGIGLGLAMSRKIVALYGGTISLEATEKTGSRFVVTLPTS